MKLISTRIHGVVDYLVSVFVIASPWLLNFSRNGAETWVPVVLGTGSIIYSLCTDYEFGPLKTISMKWHLGLDFLSAILLASSPWLFGFADWVSRPHVLIGLMEIAIVLMSSSNAYSGRHRFNQPPAV